MVMVRGRLVAVAWSWSVWSVVVVVVLYLLGPRVEITQEPFKILQPCVLLRRLSLHPRGHDHHGDQGSHFRLKTPGRGSPVQVGKAGRPQKTEEDRRQKTEDAVYLL